MHVVDVVAFASPARQVRRGEKLSAPVLESICEPRRVGAAAIE
jgi:hypothetical protein